MGMTDLKITYVASWSSGGEVARVVRRSLPKPVKMYFFPIGEESRTFVVCFLHTSSQMFFIRRLADRVCQVSWHSRWFHRSMSVEVSASRCFESNTSLAHARRHLDPIFHQRSTTVVCFYFINYMKIRAHSERHTYSTAGIFEIQTFLRQAWCFQ